METIVSGLPVGPRTHLDMVDVLESHDTGTHETGHDERPRGDIDPNAHEDRPQHDRGQDRGADGGVHDEHRRRVTSVCDCHDSRHRSAEQPTDGED